MSSLRCPTCGAPASDDGRSCAYCGSGVRHARLAELVAAVEAGQANLHEHILGILRVLQSAIPRRVTLETAGRHGPKALQVRHAIVELDSEQFSVDEDRGVLRTTIGMVSGGIVLNHEQVSAPVWLTRLDAALRRLGTATISDVHEMARLVPSATEAQEQP